MVTLRPDRLTHLAVAAIIYRTSFTEGGEQGYETDLATETYSAFARTWFYETYGDPQRSARAESSPRQGALEVDCLVLSGPVSAGLAWCCPGLCRGLE
jgi:hypothetical protein